MIRKLGRAWDRAALTPIARLLAFYLIEKEELGSFSETVEDAGAWVNAWPAQIIRAARELEEAGIIRFRVKYEPNVIWDASDPEGLEPRLEGEVFPPRCLPQQDHRRKAVLRRTNGRCYYCGSRGGGQPMHLDHMDPKSKGGRGTHRNLVAACAKCNQQKNAKTADQYREFLAKKDPEFEGDDFLAFTFYWEHEG